MADYGDASELSEDGTTATLDEGDAFLRKAKGWFRKDKEHSAEWRREAKDDYDFVAGHQWTEEDKAKLAEEMRPVITFNRILPTVEAVVGLEIGNRREVQYIPRELGDAKKNEVLTAAAEWARDECDAEDEETDSFQDLIICGVGCTETRFEYEEDPQGKVVVERINPLETYVDSSARKRNYVDARRAWRVRTMPCEEAEALFPEADISDLDAAWARGDDTKEPHNADPEVAYQDDGDNEKPGTGRKEVTIVHLQWWEREAYYKVALNGQTEDVDASDYPKLKQRADQLQKAFPGMMEPMRAVKMMRRVYKQAFIGATVLEMGPSPCEGHFSWEFVTGKRDHNSGTFYGLVRMMKDPQRWANKWLAQSLHILNSNAKGGMFAERGAFDNDADAEDTYANPSKITWTKKGALAGGMIQPKQTAAFPTGFDNLLQFALSSLRDVSGVNLELLGLRDANQPGVLEEHRKQAGMTILATLFDALRLYRKRQGRILLYYITERMSDGRLIRIVGEEGAQYVPLIHEPGSAEYDVIVDDSPTSPNQKEKVFATFMQLLPMFGKAISPEDISLLLEYSPLPTAIVQKWQEQQKARAEQQAPQQQQAMQMAQQTHQAETAETVASAGQKDASAALDRVKAAKEAATPITLPMPANPMGGY